jgi:hypothetical protein
VKESFKKNRLDKMLCSYLIVNQKKIKIGGDIALWLARAGTHGERTICSGQ